MPSLMGRPIRTPSLPGLSSAPQPPPSLLSCWWKKTTEWNDRLSNVSDGTSSAATALFSYYLDCARLTQAGENSSRAPSDWTNWRQQAANCSLLNRKQRSQRSVWKVSSRRSIWEFFPARQNTPTCRHSPLRGVFCAFSVNPPSWTCTCMLAFLSHAYTAFIIS